MSKREIVAIIALLVGGFIAYEIFAGREAMDPNEVAPGETPRVAQGEGGGRDAAGMKAVVPAALASELVAVMRERYDLPSIPANAGVLAVAGNPGEYFFTRRDRPRTEVCVMRATGPEVLWTTETDRILEIVGSHGAELLLKFSDAPFAGPADAWYAGGFYALDMFAPGDGIHAIDLDPEIVADIRSTIR
jgi:hypothetical protein